MHICVHNMYNKFAFSVIKQIFLFFSLVLFFFFFNKSCMLQQRVTRGILHLYRSSFIRLQNALRYLMNWIPMNIITKKNAILIFKNSSVKYASLLTSISKNIFQLSASYAHLNYHHRSSSRTFSHVFALVFFHWFPR